MAILQIVTYPNKLLEKKCKKVADFDERLWSLLDDMYDTMVEADGVGLAAPQVGILEQIAVIDAGDENGKIELINPVLIEKRGNENGIEGCLSIPGIYGEVKRASFIKIKAQDRMGKAFILEASGFLARVIQHEMDHLNGVLFTTKAAELFDEDELETIEG